MIYGGESCTCQLSAAAAGGQQLNADDFYEDILFPTTISGIINQPNIRYPTQPLPSFYFKEMKVSDWQRKIQLCEEILDVLKVDF